MHLDQKTEGLFQREKETGTNQGLKVIAFAENYTKKLLRGVRRISDGIKKTIQMNKEENYYYLQGKET